MLCGGRAVRHPHLSVILRRDFVGLRIAALDRREVRLNGRGLNYGVVITLAFLAACVYLIATGHGVEGTVLGVIFIIGLVAVIAFGRRR